MDTMFSHDRNAILILMKNKEIMYQTHAFISGTIYFGIYQKLKYLTIYYNQRIDYKNDLNLYLNHFK